MPEKDITEKILEDYNDVFADLVNVLLFNGERLVQPEELEDIQVHSQYKADDDKIHELERDVMKKWRRGNVEFGFFGVENQTRVEKWMPFRVIGYDGATCRSQLLEDKEKISPVVTFVLYFGTEYRWYGKKNIKALLDIPKELEPYVNDYRIHVVNVAWLTDEQIELFQSDFKVVARFFSNKRKKINDIQDETVIKHVDEVLKLLSVMTGDRRYEAYPRGKEKGEAHKMCEVLDWYIGQGIEQGTERAEDRVTELGRILLAENRKEDALKALVNEEYRYSLYAELGI